MEATHFVVLATLFLVEAKLFIHFSQRMEATLFVVNKDKWDTKEGHGKAMKNALYV